VRAVWLREFGPPSVLVAGEAPEPAGEVVIEVALANITFVETQVRAGRGPFPVKLPMIMGNGVGGTVDGRRVIASLGGSGGYAERVAVPAASLIDVPDGIALDDAVALLADGRTATMLAEAAAPQAGERVLILAAAGGVGTLLVQLARAAGATVVGAVGSDAKRAVVASLGGEGVRYEDLAGPFDVVFDGVGGEVARSAFALLGHETMQVLSMAMPDTVAVFATFDMSVVADALVAAALVAANVRFRAVAQRLRMWRGTPRR